MGQRGDGLVEVVLVEDDLDVNDGVERVPGPWIGRRIGTWWSPGPARLRSGAARLGATIAAVTCIAVVVQQGTLAAEEAVLAGLPGRSVSLAEPLHEVWHLDETSPFGWVGSDLIAGANSRTTQRIDPTTGAVRWSASTGGGCQLLESVGWGDFPGGSLQRLDGVRLVCSMSGTDLRDPADRTDGIVVLDTADGTTMPGPRIEGTILGLVPFGGDVVIVTANAEGRVLAERWSPDSGQTVWRYAGTERVVDQGNSYAMLSGSGSLWVESTPGLLLDLETGRERSATEDSLGARVEQLYTVSQSTLADGSTVHGSIGETWTFDRTSADGTALPPLPGWPLEVGVDDGSGAGSVLVFTQDSTMEAVDLGTGDVRWTVPGYVIAVVAVVGGLVVTLTDGGEISAHDLATGAEVWTAPVSQEQYFGSPVTDGRTVGYLTLLDPDAAPAGSRLVLRVVDLQTGVERGQTPIAGYSATLIGTASDGTVLVATPEGRLAGFRP